MIDSFHSSGSFSFFQIEVISLWISKQIVLPPALISSAGISSIPGDLWLFSLSIASSTSAALGSGTSGSAVCFILVGLNYPSTIYVSLSDGFNVSNGKRRKLHKEHCGELIERNRFLMQARWSSATSLWFLFSETWLRLVLDFKTNIFSLNI